MKNQIAIMVSIKKNCNQPGYEVTEMGWSVVPDGLRELLVGLQRQYHMPAIYVTENGAAFADQVEEENEACVHDERRVEYLREHFTAARRAIFDGVPLRGYFVWSLLDNFNGPLDTLNALGPFMLITRARRVFSKTVRTICGKLSRPTLFDP